jgi:hypothetical protein
MSGRKPPSEAALVRAAELRTLGLDWKTTAKEMKKSPNTISRWPQMYAERWAQACVEAQRRAMAAMAGESFGTLRRLLSSADDKIRLAAARWIAHYRFHQSRLDLATLVAKTDVPEMARIIAQILESYTDEQLKHLAGLLDGRARQNHRRSVHVLPTSAA